MPRPLFVRDLLRPETRQALGAEEFARRLDVAVAYVVAMQEAAGLDIISDGEWRRLSYIGVIADICDGFQVGYDFRYANPIGRAFLLRATYNY